VDALLSRIEGAFDQVAPLLTDGLRAMMRERLSFNIR
jgi:hypothetical protein